MKKFRKISLEQKMRKLDRLSKVQMTETQGGQSYDNCNFTISPVTPSPSPYTISFSISPCSGGPIYRF